MKRTWTIIGVKDVSSSFKWYQSLNDGLREQGPHKCQRQSRRDNLRRTVGVRHEPIPAKRTLASDWRCDLTGFIFGLWEDRDSGLSILWRYRRRAVVVALARSIQDR